MLRGILNRGARALSNPIIKNRNFLLSNMLKKSEDGKRLIELAVAGHVVSGYVPYVRGQTLVQVHHFFSFNYGHRKSFKMNISLFENGLMPIISKTIELAARTTVLIDIDAEFTDCEKLDKATTCVITLVHERIPIGHAGHEGHLRYWGIYGDYGAFVHSMPLPSSLNLVRKGFSYPAPAVRRCYSQEAPHVSNVAIFNSSINVASRGDVDEISLSPIGYSVVKDKEFNVRGCFHMAAPWPKNYVAKEVDASFIHLPPVPDIDGQLYFREWCDAGAKINLTVFKMDDATFEQTELFNCKIEVNLQHGVRLSEILPSPVLQMQGIWIKIIPISGQFSNKHLNIVYVSRSKNTPLDCVHNVGGVIGSGNCLKFAPFNFSDGKDNWLSLNGALDVDTLVRLRFTFLDNPNHEFVTNKLVPADTVLYVNIEEFLKGKEQYGNSGVVQVESLERNIGSIMCIAKTNGYLEKLAADHLTGG